MALTGAQGERILSAKNALKGFKPKEVSKFWDSLR